MTWAWSLLIGSFLLFYVSSMYLELSLGFRFNGDPFPAVFNSGFGPWFDYRLDEEIFAMFQNSFFVGVEILSLFLFGLYIGRERKLLTWSIQGLTQTAIICTVTALPFFAVIIWHHYGSGAEYSATNSAAVLVSGNYSPQRTSACSPSLFEKVARSPRFKRSDEWHSRTI